MADANRRLVVFSNKGDEDDGLPYQWGYMVENVYGDDSLDPATCASPRSQSYHSSVSRAGRCCSSITSRL